MEIFLTTNDAVMTYGSTWKGELHVNNTDRYTALYESSDCERHYSVTRDPTQRYNLESGIGLSRKLISVANAT